MINKNKDIRPIAFYLPQYHPIPENDIWWGKGFTEWTNVVQGKPLFRGHYQPHIPADLGFYDLRLPETRQAQADLANEYGIYGFCYYHYWFHGRRLLELPFNEVLKSGKPDFPFCLCWANESWMRNWDGTSGNKLLEQTYSQEDDLKHIQWLIKAFSDERYIRINNKPLFLVYRASQLPDPLRTTQVWREECKRLGIGNIFLCKVENFKKDQNDPKAIGFDASVEFQPNYDILSEATKSKYKLNRIIVYILKYIASKLNKFLRLNNRYADEVFDYSNVVNILLHQPSPPYVRFPCVTPSWDNSPRRKTGAFILHNSTPEFFEKWLRGTIEKSNLLSQQHRYIFINAWNEWAEGNHLEPCQRWGTAYLEAVRRVIQDNSK
jgi:lipopolysaccharide biosynthesis protein